MKRLRVSLLFLISYKGAVFQICLSFKLRLFKMETYGKPFVPYFVRRARAHSMLPDVP